MAQINLLPRKAFEITLADGKVIKGQFSLWASKRYADKKGYSLQQLIEKSGVENISFDDICQILLCAVEYVSRKEKQGFAFSDIDACEWIEEMGGLIGEQFQKLMDHAKDSESEQVDEEKKSPLSGGI